MKLAVDAQPLLDAEKTGVSWYTKMMTQYICADQSVQLQLNYAGYRQYWKRKKIVDCYRERGIKVRHSWLPVRVRRKMEKFCPISYSFIFGGNPDVTIFFNFEVPYGAIGKMMVVVHDMTYKVFPETVSEETKSWLNEIMERTCERADMIVTVSDYSKKEIIKYLNVNPQKVQVIPCGVDLERYTERYAENDVIRARQAYHIPEKYLLYIGTLEPRKNIERLIEAYAQLVKKEAKTPVLVIGGKKGWMYEKIFSRVKEQGIEAYVIFTGYLADEDVPLLMKGAIAFVFPSLYEGFGMPVLEAMACGTPVITSNTASLPEVVGQAGLLVDPYNVTEIAEAMERVIKDDIMRNTMRSRGLIQVRNYTWKNSAEKMKKLYHQLAGAAMEEG